MIIRAKFKDVVILPETEQETTFIKGRFREYMNDPTGEFKFSFDLEDIMRDWYGQNTKEFKARLKMIQTERDS